MDVRKLMERRKEEGGNKKGKEDRSEEKETRR